MIDIASIEEYLSRQGRFCLIDWLLTDNLLHYSDYEAWRYGELKNLDDVLKLERKKLQVLIEHTDRYCEDLGLIAEPQEFFRWDGNHRVLLMASDNSERSHRLMQCWLRPQDRPQLDLFLDNSEQIAENAVLEALDTRRFELAQSQLQKLSELNPECTRLGGYQDLINYGLHICANPEIEEEAVEVELQGLQQEVLPLAQEILGSVARDYLAFAWRRLANAMQSMAFNPEKPWLHASSALLKIPDHAAVVEYLNDDPELYRQTTLLERLALSHSAMHRRENALILWCLLMELDTGFTEQALSRDCSNQVYTLWQDFWDFDDSWSSTFFPAYILIRHPGLLHYLERFQALQLSASKAALALLEKRSNGEDEISARQTLQTISPELLAVYLQHL